MIKGFKIRLYPTAEQEQKMWQHIGACRYVWNYMLAEQIRRYENGEKHLSQFDMTNLLKPLKNDGEHDWMYECSNTSYQRVCTDLDKAYKSLFKKQARKPKFKSRKKSKPSCPTREDRMSFYGNCVQLEKIGRVKYKTDFEMPQGTGHKFSDARVSNVNGKWILSFGMECENQAPILTDKPMGIDLGVKETMTVACGDEQIVFHNINKSAKMRYLKRQLKHVQRTISRKYEANKQGKKYIKTKNIEREEAKARKLYARMANIRQNYNHQSTHKLISLLPARVTMESLNVLGMMKNKYLSKAVAEQNFHEIIRQMQYKCEWNGIPFVQVDTFYPSSKLCSGCGCKKTDLKLKDRTYICKNCGLVIDRDYNAAINLMRYEA